MINRESRCPLCGAEMTPTDLIDACSEFANDALGVLAAHCPHCQGRLEIRPANGQIELGYCGGNNSRFDVAYALPLPELVVMHTDTNPHALILTCAERRWTFQGD